MANSLLTIGQITKETVRLFRNSNAFIMAIDRQYDDSFAVTGAKIGNSIRIRLPNDYTVNTGAAINVQDTQEVYTTLTVSTQKNIAMSFSSVDRALSLDKFSERVLAPAVNNLAGAVAADIMSGAEAIPNIVFNGSTATLSPTAATFLLAGATLDQASAPKGDRKIVLDPLTEARTVNTLMGLFNPGGTISEQFKSGDMARALGFSWFMDQTVLKHTSGTYNSAATVSGSNQSGQSITVGAISGTLVKGDIVTFSGVNQVNRVTKVSTGTLMQFVVTANVSNGGTSIPIYPALTPPISSSLNAQFQTVDSFPVSGSSTLKLAHPASETTRKNFVFRPEAVTMATVDLELPKGAVVEAAREQLDGISMRMISDYITATDQFVTRLDILYGYVWVRPEWACVVSDMV